MATNLVVHVFNNDVESALRNLKKQMIKHGVLKDIKRKAFYEKPSVKRKRKQIEARKKLRKAESRRLAGERNDEQQWPSREITSRRISRGAAA